MTTTEMARLQTAAAAFDDEALAAFTNPGLVRRARKLLDAAAPALDETADGVAAHGDGWHVRVRVGAALTTARCDCPTGAGCQHVVAFVLALRARASATPPPALLASLLAIDDAQVRRWCGVTGLRWAHDRASSLDDGEVVVEESAYLTVRLPVPLPTVRFMTRELDDAVVDPVGRDTRRVVVLAWLLMCRRSGRLPPAPPSGPRQAGVGPKRTEALADAIVAVQDAVQLGLLHLPDTFATRLESLAAGLRGAGWYRAGGLAARAADELDGLLRHHAAADTAVLLATLTELAVVAGEIQGLAAHDSSVPPSLAGIARALYEPVGDLDLVGCGHVQWGDSMFGGTLAVLADLRSNNVFTVSVADRTRGFGQSAGLAWQGSLSLTALAGRRIALGAARASDDLRLSNSAATTAQSSAAPAGWWLQHPWSGDLPSPPSRLHDRNGARWVVATVEHAGGASFDPLLQRVTWPIRSAGVDVLVELAFGPNTLLAVPALENVAAQQPSHLVGRLRVAPHGAVLEPVSAIVGGRLVVLAEGTSSNRHPQSGHTVTAASLPTARPRAGVVRLAERGTGPGAAARVEQVAAQADEYGFTSVASVLRAAPSPALAVIRATWLLDEHDRLIAVADVPRVRG